MSVSWSISPEDPTNGTFYMVPTVKGLDYWALISQSLCFQCCNITLFFRSCKCNGLLLQIMIKVRKCERAKNCVLPVLLSLKSLRLLAGPFLDCVSDS
jgi:hypothetical protein